MEKQDKLERLYYLDWLRVIAVLPVYILHQTVIIVLGFYVVKLNLHVFVKYGIINVLSFVVTLALYEIIVKRIGVLRFLFGLHLKRSN